MASLSVVSNSTLDVEGKADGAYVGSSVKIVTHRSVMSPTFRQNSLKFSASMTYGDSEEIFDCLGSVLVTLSLKYDKMD